MTDWKFKIHAYLHDPPDKPFALMRRLGHAEWGRHLATILAGEPDPAWEPMIRRADWLASGAERSGELPRVPPSLSDLRHPLSGQRINLGEFGKIGPEAQDQARAALEEEFSELARHNLDPGAAFAALWGLLLPRLRARRGPQELGALWYLLPAETRMPNHSVAVHQSLTSAIASILKDNAEPILLNFSIGPVQRFIENARRTSDLWGGSAMLSRAILRAVAPIVEEVGPDHVIFPALARSDAFLGWLVKESAWAAQLGRLAGSLSIPDDSPGGLPNRFLAILPGNGAEAIAQKCERRVREWWKTLIGNMGRDLEKDMPALRGFSQMAEAQADASLQVHWAASPWPAAESVAPGDAHCTRVSWIRNGALPSASKAFIQAGGRFSASEPIRGFKPNGGVLYAAAYDAASFLLDCVKRTRIPPARSENGLKCSLCGERGVFPDVVSFEEQRAVWAAVRDELARRGLLRRGEALCGVCWAKRRYALGKTVPSTAEIAASPFKLQVLNRFSELETEAMALVRALEKGAPNVYRNAYTVPALLPYINARGNLAEFARVDGEILLAHPRERRELETDGSAEIDPAVFKAVRRLREAASNIRITLPRPYLAVIAMDGDSMGKWLSGEKNLALKEYLSQAAADELEASGATSYLSLKWPMTPSMHGVFSEACATFSQSSAIRTLHDEGLPSFLVYAGGDDVLALSAIGCPYGSQPLEYVTEAVRNLRLRFSGHVRREHGGDVPDPQSGAGFVIDPRNGLQLAFGQNSSASAGIAVFHYKWPLSRALAEARRAEDYAKDVMRRDALGIAILRRSGQITLTGLRFRAQDEADIVRRFQQVCHAFAHGGLSPRYLSEVKRTLGRLGGSLEQEDLEQLASPIMDQAVSDHCEQPASVPSIVDSIRSLGRAAQITLAESGKNSGPDSTAFMQRWLDLIEAAAFLSRGEEE